MTAALLRTRLVGAEEDNGLVQLTDFVDHLQNLKECLKRCEKRLTGKRPATKYRIVKLATNSAEVAIEPIAAQDDEHRGEQIISFFRTILRALQQGECGDLVLDRDHLEVFGRFLNPLKRGARAIWFDDIELTEQYAKNIQKMLGQSIKSYGAVSGILEKLNLHRETAFGIYPFGTDHQIKCTFPAPLLPQVCRAIKRNVTVTGLLSFEPGKLLPTDVDVEKIEIHPPDSELPGLSSLKGALAGCLEGLDSVTFVRRLRDDEPT
jgi:hypothetical protein